MIQEIPTMQQQPKPIEFVLYHGDDEIHAEVIYEGDRPILSQLRRRGDDPLEWGQLNGLIGRIAVAAGVAVTDQAQQEIDASLLADFTFDEQLADDFTPSLPTF